MVFAGPVAGVRYVTVLHPDGLRSSYGHLAGLLVTAGERVVIGQVVGTAGERLHLGVRSGGTYLDPAALFTTTGVHLVPLDVRATSRRRVPRCVAGDTRGGSERGVGLADGRWGRGRRRYTRPSVVTTTARRPVHPCHSRGRLRAQAHGLRQNRRGGKNQMAPVVTMKQLLDAGVHFGHQTRRWNPKMKRFLHGERQGIYIIDLEQTLDRVRVAYEFVRDMTADGGNLLFVGTKKQASDAVEQYAMSCNMPYVNQRWLGGMLTNFETISKRVSKMADLEHQRDSGEFDAMPKKEALMNTRELDKLLRNLNGIRNLDRKPDAVFVLDTKKEHIAVTEANKLGIPLIAVVDTNCDPDVVDYVIPGNDDAIRSGSLMCRIMADAVKEGRYIRSKKVPGEGGPPAAPALRTPEEEAEIARQQAEARDEAARQAAEREARVAAAKAEADAAPDGPAASVEQAPAAEAPAEEAVAPSTDAPADEAVTVEVEAPVEQAVVPEADAPAPAVADETAEAATTEPREEG